MLHNIFLIIVKTKHKDPNKLVSNSLQDDNRKYSTTIVKKLRKNLHAI